MKAIVVIAAWSSGSTAVAGYLDRCGAYTCPPHVRTSDDLTPNAYEPLIYRNELARLIDEFSLKRYGKIEDFIKFFDAWWDEECVKADKLGCTHIVLKHPLQTFILPYLNRKISPTYIFVTRPFGDIEKTRKRRNWHSVHGESGAKVIYITAYDFLVNNSCPFVSVPFDKFRTDDAFRRKILNFIDFSPTDEKLEDANSFLR